jgi:hypothetical protein
MSQCGVMVTLTCTTTRWKKLYSVSPPEDEYEYEFEYQVWLLVQEVGPGDRPKAAPTQAQAADTDGSNEAMQERFQDAMADVLAGRIEGTVWRIAGLGPAEATNVLTGIPDAISEPLQEQLEKALVGAGIPVSAAGLGADMAATFLLQPILEPLEEAVHALEAAGIVVGLVLASPHVMVVFAKPLIHDKIGSLLSEAVNGLARELQELVPGLENAAEEGRTAAPAVRAELRSREILEMTLEADEMEAGA